MRQEKHYLYNAGGDWCGLYIIQGDRAAYRSVFDGKAMLPHRFDNLNQARKHARTLALVAGGAF